MKAWPILGISLIQILLLLAHWFVYHTWITLDPLSPAAQGHLRTAMLVLAFSFCCASLLSFRFFSLPVALFYRLAAIWLGFLNYFFWAACLCWPIAYALRIFAPHSAYPALQSLAANALFGLALLIGIYGMVNARFTRVRRISVALPGLPAAWRGRKAVLLSDLHLGHVNGVRFCRRMTALAASFDPAVVFLPGDVFDGTSGDLDRLLAPLSQLKPHFGIFFSSGNHEEFHDTAQYLAAIERAGIRILANERVTVDGLHIAGIPYHDSTSPLRVRTTLEKLRPNPAAATILLNHAPTRLPIVEQAGVSLQLSGHTHGGQFAPFTWITHGIFGPFTYGLHNFGALQVYTSSGCGTWGPPMRVGSRPEIVVLTFA